MFFVVLLSVLLLCFAIGCFMFLRCRAFCVLFMSLLFVISVFMCVGLSCVLCLADDVVFSMGHCSWWGYLGHCISCVWSLYFMCFVFVMSFYVFVVWPRM